MITLSANVSKKVPIPGEEYSSRSYMAGIQVEVDNLASTDDIQQKLNDIYAMLEETVDEQIEEAAPPKQPERRKSNPDGNGNGKAGKAQTAKGKRRSRAAGATEAQVKAVYAISKSKGFDREDLAEWLFRRFKMDKAEALTISEASEAIDALQKVEV